MKRFLLFSYGLDEPAPGFYAFDGDFDTVNAAKDHLATMRWWTDAHIVDTTWKIVPGEKQDGICWTGRRNGDLVNETFWDENGDICDQEG